MTFLTYLIIGLIFLIFSVILNYHFKLISKNDLDTEKDKCLFTIALVVFVLLWPVALIIMVLAIVVNYIHNILPKE